MKYVPFQNQPNVSETRFQSISPSMKLDNRGYPHIAWLEQKEGRNEIHYSFWDGLKWSYKNSPKIYISEQEIISSPNSLILTDNGDPYIAFSRKNDVGSVLTVANYRNVGAEWNMNDLSVDYDAEWIGIITYERGLDFSTSSFSSATSSSSESSAFNSSSSSVGWTPLGGGDHNGEDWILDGNQLFNGEYYNHIANHHFNINNFEIINNESIYVEAWNGNNYGTLRVDASYVNINSYLSSDGSGYKGGSGGGGGGGADEGRPGNGGSGGLGVNGQNAESGGSGYNNGRVQNAGNGGDALNGYGAYGGIKGTGGNGSTWYQARDGFPGNNGDRGGYNIAGGNAIEVPVTNSIYMGSGGGGAGGGGGGHSTNINTGGGAGGGGGGGGHGGGKIYITSQTDLDISGTILARGVLGANGNKGGDSVSGRLTPGGKGGSGANSYLIQGGFGGNGGSGKFDSRYDRYSGNGGKGGNGGDAAGGGILLQGNNINLAGSFINNAGSSGFTVNGGALKIFYGNNYVPGSYIYGRLYEEIYNTSSESSSESPANTSTSSSNSSSESSDYLNSSSSSYSSSTSSLQYSSSLSSSSSSSELYSSSSDTSSSSESWMNTSSSSSSSSSFNDGVMFVCVYDVTNGKYIIYSVTNDAWHFLTSINENISGNDIKTTRIDPCGRKIGIAYVNNSSVIKHNFFDLDYLIWSFGLFEDIYYSKNYGNIIDMDFSGYSEEEEGRMAMGWISTNNHYSYINGIIASDIGTQWPTDESNVVVEANPVNVVTNSDYIVNSYRKIAISLKEVGYPQMIATGSASKIFSLGYSQNGGKNWRKEIIDMDFVAGSVVFLYLKSEFYGYEDDNSRIIIGLDTGDVYYFKVNLALETFPVSNPSVVVLNNDEAYHANYQSGQMAGNNIDGIQDNWVGANLTDGDIPLFITPDVFSSSSSSLLYSSSSSSLSEVSSSSSFDYSMSSLSTDFSDASSTTSI